MTDEERTELRKLIDETARLRAFVRDVYNEFDCTRECDEADSETAEGTPPNRCPCGGDECWRCAAAQALDPPPWRTP